MPENNASQLSAPAIVLEFHHRPKNAARPHDERENTDFLEWLPGSFIPIPAVDDTVSYNSWKHTGPGDLDGEDIVVMRKVASRHFYIHQDHIVAYVVVTDLSSKEAAGRVKE
jgi:hypothetical protein